MSEPTIVASRTRTMGSDKDLCYLTASEAIAAFKAKTLSPVD